MTINRNFGVCNSSLQNKLEMECQKPFHLFLILEEPRLLKLISIMNNLSFPKFNHH